MINDGLFELIRFILVPEKKIFDFRLDNLHTVISADSSLFDEDHSIPFFPFNIILLLLYSSFPLLSIRSLFYNK